MIKKSVLKNNITLLTHNVPLSNSVSIGFWFNVGSRSEGKGESGITHFTEHMLFKGTKDFSTHQIACVFDRMGGYVNAFTEREDVCLHCTIPYSDNNFANALDLLCRMTHECNFPIDEFEREKQVVENEIISVMDDPEETALDFVSSSVWPGQTLSSSITGSLQDVESISREKLMEWYKKYFASGELTVCVAGKFNETDLLQKLEEQPVHLIPKVYPQQKHFDQNPQWHSGFFSKKDNFLQAQAFLLCPYSMPVTEKENYTLSILNAIAGDTMSSRLFESLREKKGLCYNVYSFVTIYEDAAAWCAYVSCDPKKGLDVLEALQNEVLELSENGITDEELESAKEHLCGEEVLGSNDSEYLMKRLQRNYSLGLPLKNTDEIVEYIRTIDKNDIMEVIGRLFNKEKMALVYYGKGFSKKQKGKILCRMKSK